MMGRIWNSAKSGRFHLFQLARENEPSWQSLRPQAYWDYRQEWDNTPEHLIFTDYPVHIDVEMTARCNLRCPMCQREKIIETGPASYGDMEWEVYTRIIDECAGNVRSLKLNFRGEPLLHPQLEKAIKYAKERGFVEVMLNTNATLLSSKRAQALLEAGLDSIIFSFDFADKQRYQTSRVGANYEKVLENIRRFCKLRKIGGYSSIRTRINALQENDAEIEVKPFLELFGDVIDEINMFGKHPRVRDFTLPIDDYRDYFDLADYRCGSLWQRFGFLYNGVLMPCCNAYEEIKGVGSIKNSSVKELWRSAYMRRLRGFHANKRGYLVDECKNCFKFLFRLKWALEKDGISLGDISFVKQQNNFLLQKRA